MTHLLGALIDLLRNPWGLLPDHWVSDPPDSSLDAPMTWCCEHGTIDLRMGAFTTGSYGGVFVAPGALSAPRRNVRDRAWLS